MNRQYLFKYIFLLLFALVPAIMSPGPVIRPVLAPAPAGTEAVPVLLYHKVSPNPLDGMLGLRVTPEAFESQMKYLKFSGYHPISLDRLFEHWDRGAPLPPRPVVITFDDGYRDNYLFAFPILKKYGYTATIFLVCDCIGKENSWDAGKIMHPRLKLLSWNEIREMQAYGISFQAHTLTHPSLTTITPEQANKEISSCKTALEKALGVPVRYLAYPFGRSNQDIEEMVRAAGYRAAFSTCKGKAHRHQRRFHLNRLGVDGRRNLAEFAKMIE